MSIHAPHTGRDPFFSSVSLSASEFQSTRPIRGATIAFYAILDIHNEFQSTRPIRGATGEAAPPSG